MPLLRGFFLRENRLMSLHPAQDNIEIQRKREAIELCGKNRGPHDYIPIEWKYVRENQAALIEVKRVTRLLCKICYAHVSIKTLLQNYPDVSQEKADS